LEQCSQAAFPSSSGTVALARPQFRQFHFHFVGLFIACSLPKAGDGLSRWFACPPEGIGETHAITAAWFEIL
jgi:hypothetical protein